MLILMSLELRAYDFFTFVQNRLPYSFEVLDGAVPCTQERLSLFLDRVKAFPSLRFTIISAEKLSSHNLEMLVAFLSDREVGSLGICFHCIQRGDSLIHTAPWIEGRSWDAESPKDLKHNWSKSITEKIEVMVVAGAHTGTGKTRFIREQQKARLENMPNAQSASTVIHEKSSIFSLVRTLRRKFRSTQGKCALHISFAFIPFDRMLHEDWLREINHFFFSMIVLRHVYDPIAATSFSFTGEWELFIELPGTVCEDADSWLKRNIPTIYLCAILRNPGKLFVLDDEARRVCTYLRAYENGTINRRYEGAAKKRIVLVLDTSGSMGGIPYRDAICNAVNIFDSHVVEGDVSNLGIANRRVILVDYFSFSLFRRSSG
jgi:hypothetical protein